MIVNRPTAMSISEALPQVPHPGRPTHDMLYSGGPVQTNQVMMLYRISDTPENSHQVFDGVCLGGDLEIMERILVEQPERNRSGPYLGYSGWGPGQLESEMQTGSWITLPADPFGRILCLRKKRPLRIWSDIVLSLDETSRHYADMPFDPSSDYGTRNGRA